MDIEEIDLERLPRHIAIIMDGNGRWAKARGLSRIAGHREGAKSVRVVVEACREIGIKILTLYAFSEENWGRPWQEIQGLMELLDRYLVRERKNMIKNGIRLCTIGEIERLPQKVYNRLLSLKEETIQNSEFVLNLALSYGGRGEIVRAIKRIGEKLIKGNISLDKIDKEMVGLHLDTGDLPDPDLLIRTSGEKRISNFLLWQLAYTELYFTPVFWPDFRKEHLIQAILDYQKRERRFGLTSEQLK